MNTSCSCRRRLSSTEIRVIKRNAAGVYGRIPIPTYLPTHPPTHPPQERFSVSAGATQSGRDSKYSTVKCRMLSPVVQVHRQGKCVGIRTLVSQNYSLIYLYPFFSLAYNDVKRLHFLLDCVVCHLYLSSIYECDECVSHFSNFSLKFLMSITIIQRAPQVWLSFYFSRRVLPIVEGGEKTQRVHFSPLSTFYAFRLSYVFLKHFRLTAKNATVWSCARGQTNFSVV